MGCGTPGSSVQGIFQARILEQVAVSYARGSFPSRDQSCIFCIFCIGRQILYHWAIWEAQILDGEGTKKGEIESDYHHPKATGQWRALFGGPSPMLVAITWAGTGRPQLPEGRCRSAQSRWPKVERKNEWIWLQDPGAIGSCHSLAGNSKLAVGMATRVRTAAICVLFQFCQLLLYRMEKVLAPHSSTLAWKIPWMEEPGRLQSMGLQRVGHNWATSFSLFTFMHWKRKWQPTGESQGRGSLVGCHLWGCTESDTKDTT